jgi:transporter family-2 protein
MTAALLAGALLLGCLLAVQASVNLQLNKAVGTPYGASTLQLWVAATVLAVLALAAGAWGALGGVAEAPFWYLIGGLASPLYITSGILLFPRMGALAAVGLFVAGQMFASMTIDLFGLFGVQRQPLTVGIVAGSVAVLAGITTIIRGQRTAVAPVPVPAGSPAAPATGTPTAVASAARPAPTSSGIGAASPGWLLLGLVAGAVLPIQGAINARLRTVLEQPIAVALFSFAVAAVTISVVLVVLLATRRTPQPQLGHLRGMPWWGWLGGICAAGYVTGTFLLIPLIGAAVTVALTVTGQQLASAVIDARGWLRLPRRPLTAMRGAGLAFLVAGSLLVELF